MKNKTIVRDIIKKYLLKELEKSIKCNNEKIKTLSEGIELLENKNINKGIEKIREIIDVLYLENESFLIETVYIEEDNKLFNLDYLLKDEYFK